MSHEAMKSNEEKPNLVLTPEVCLELGCDTVTSVRSEQEPNIRFRCEDDQIAKQDLQSIRTTF